MLRVLQEREYTPVGETRAIPFDVKIISASSLSLEKAVDQGRFREDLRYRLEVMPINLPPLRARVSDIETLFDYFLSIQLKRHNRAGIDVDDTVYDCIEAYHWPGNVRELVNVCTYIAALVGEGSKVITIADLPLVITTAKPKLPSEISSVVADNSENPDKMVAVTTNRSRRITKEKLVQVIQDYSGHRESIAKHLGISRMTLWRRMKGFDLVD